ncbi:MAG TPA: hypothetical protein VEQ59_22520, partial [Polyangiaceae bacterium]|nr:hypothetical protein [Polyangiaceae bacterium]
MLRTNLAMEQLRLFQFSAAALLKGGTVVRAVWLWKLGAITVGDFVMAVSLSLLIIAEVRNSSRRFRRRERKYDALFGEPWAPAVWQSG